MSAQNPIFNNPGNRAYFGVRIAGEVTCPGSVSQDNYDIEMFNNGGGLEFGGIYNIPVVANLYIEPGLKFFYNTFSMNEDLLYFLQDDLLFDSASYRNFGLRIPVMAGYHFDFTEDIKTYVFTGPELEIGLYGKEHVKGDIVSTNNDIYGKDGAFNRVNLLWGIGAGVSYQNFYFSISGGIGMLNMVKESNLTFHENRVTFSLGYNF